MQNPTPIEIKGHSTSPLSSDAVGFYKDYWNHGLKIPPHSVEFRKTVLQKFFPAGITGKKVAELGLGGEGGFLYWLKEKNATIGFDASQSAVKLCRQHGLDVALKNLDIGKLPLADDSVDIIFATEVFEHFSSPQFVLEEIKRVLSPEGVALISTPNPKIYHWPRLFYPEMFQKKAFRDFLMINGFKIDTMAGLKQVPIKMPGQEDNAWHWFWLCRKLDITDSNALFNYGRHFWGQKNLNGLRTKPIEALDFFRMGYQQSPTMDECRFYLARALVYRVINGEVDEFTRHVNFLIHSIDHGRDEQRMRALYHFAMIHIEATLLGKCIMTDETFAETKTRLERCIGSENYISRLNAGLMLLDKRER